MRYDILQQPTVSTPNGLGPAFLGPHEKPSLLGAPSRRDVSFSDSDPDMKRRSLMMNHKQDSRYRDSGDPPLLSRLPGPQSIPTAQPVGSRLAEEDTKRRRFSNQPPGSVRASDLSKPDQQQAHLNSIETSTSGSAPVELPSHISKSEKVFHAHELQKQNPPSRMQTSDIGSFTSLNNRELKSEGIKPNLPPPSVYITVLQEIGERCSSKQFPMYW